MFHLHKVGDLICVTTKENSHLDLKEIVNLRWILAAFHGPDREANARLFVHAGELVEALKQAERFIVDQYRCAESEALQGEILAPVARPIHKKICAILAKIDGSAK